MLLRTRFAPLTLNSSNERISFDESAAVFIKGRAPSTSVLGDIILHSHNTLVSAFDYNLGPHLALKYAVVFCASFLSEQTKMFECRKIDFALT